MSKILIAGDSNALGEWGTIVPGPSCANPDHPEVFRPWNKDKYLEGQHPKPFQVVWPGFGYYLDQKGHATVNYAFGGCGNFQALYKVEEALGLAPCFTSPVFYNPDCIVWMITEPCRDLNKLSDEAGLYDLDKYYEATDELVQNAKTIKEINDGLLQHALDGAQKIYEETNIPWIIVEGWTKVELKEHHTFVKHIHKDWMSSIIKRPVPMFSSWQTVDNIRRRRPDLTESAAESLRLFARQKPELNIPDLPKGPENEFKKIVDDYEEVIKIMEQSPLFPDNCHPDRTLQEQLAHELEPYV